MITINHTYLTRFAILALSLSSANAATPTPQSKAKTPPRPPQQREIKVYTSPTVSQTFQKIVNNNQYVLIPKGVILYLPPTHQSKVTINSGKAKSTSWEKFLSRNRNMIHTIPLTKVQVFGTKSTPPYELPYQKLEDLKKLGRIIICTYNNVPVRIKVAPKPVKK